MAGQPPPSNPSNMGGASNSALYNNTAALNGNIMPSAGHYADMQTLMQSMETLSGWLQQNREEWAGLQEGLGRVERAQAQHERLLSRGESTGVHEGGMVNGDANTQPSAENEDDTSPTITTLQSALSTSHRRTATLETQLREHEKLQSLYESTLADATERIRQYCFEQQNYIISLHRHYTTLLQQSREELVEAQLVHQGWQEGLQRLSGGVREACKAREEEREPWLGKLRGLREENRLLRKMVGWEPPEADSDDEEEMESPGPPRLEGGRGSRSSEGEGGRPGGGEAGIAQ